MSERDQSIKIESKSLPKTDDSQSVCFGNLLPEASEVLAVLKQDINTIKDKIVTNLFDGKNPCQIETAKEPSVLYPIYSRDEFYRLTFGGGFIKPSLTAPLIISGPFMSAYPKHLLPPYIDPSLIQVRSIENNIGKLGKH